MQICGRPHRSHLAVDFDRMLPLMCVLSVVPMPQQQKKHVFPAPVCHHPAIRKNSSWIFLKK
jgi:hypothetical protein